MPKVGSLSGTCRVVSRVRGVKSSHTDMTKVLFNHSQDCEVTDTSDKDCEYCDGTGFDDEDDVHCGHCEGEGFVSCDFEDLDYEPDTSVGGFVCMPPTECDGSTVLFRWHRRRCCKLQGNHSSH